MKREISVTRLDDENMAYMFAVRVGEHSYKVSLSEDYYQQLTGGKVSPEKLIEKSFEFLLEREGPESILREFALPQIQGYFPDYEQTISS